MNKVMATTTIHLNKEMVKQDMDLEKMPDIVPVF